MVFNSSCYSNEELASPKVNDSCDSPLRGVNTPRSDEDRLELMELIVFFLPKTTVAVKQVNDVTRLQALVDRKKVVVTEATIREALRLDDAEGVDCLPNEEIFTELARMGYEKPSTNLTFYKAFFSSYLVRNVDSTTKFYMYPHFLRLIIQKQVGALSTHTTKYTSPALTQRDAGSTRGVDEHVEEVTASDAAHGDDSAAHREVPTVIEEPSIPSPTPPTPPSQPPQDIPLTSQVQQAPPQSPHVQPPSPQHQHPPQPQQAADFPMSLLQEVIDACAALTRRVEHLKYDKVAQALEITNETVTVASVIITTAEPQVSAATTATLIVAHVRVAAAPKEPKPLKKKQQIEQDEQYARKLHAELNKDIDWDEAIDHVKRKAKEDPILQRYQMEEDENRALQTINETPAEKAAKRRKLNEEVEDLKSHLQIMPNEDDDVYTKATLLAKKVPVVDYKITDINNKPYYKIIR
nr:hypothetical protein [Tanacetum cinerariifolium]